MKKPFFLKNNQGDAVLVMGAGALLLAVAFLSILLSVSQLNLGLNNIKDKVKLELNNTSVRSAKMIYDDVGEHNYSAYLETFHKYESQLKNEFYVNLKKSLYIETENYRVEHESIQLSFEAKNNYINYKFRCLADIRINYFGAVFTLKSQVVNVSAKHYFKGISDGEDVTDYTYVPSTKAENDLY